MENQNTGKPGDTFLYRLYRYYLYDIFVYRRKLMPDVKNIIICIVIKNVGEI